jgi:hypothetical protein
MLLIQDQCGGSSLYVGVYLCAPLLQFLNYTLGLRSVRTLMPYAVCLDHGVSLARK